MSKQQYRHREDCAIVRDHRDYPASAVLMDCDGDVVHRFDEDWTDDQIFAALAFANKAYATGIEVGRMEKAYQIRAALNVA